MKPGEQAANLQFLKSGAIEPSLAILKQDLKDPAAPYVEERLVSVCELFSILKLGTELGYFGADDSFQLIHECQSVLSQLPKIASKTPAWTRFPQYLQNFLQTPDNANIFRNAIFNVAAEDVGLMSLFAGFVFYHNSFLCSVASARFVAAINYFEDHQWEIFSNVECDPDKITESFDENIENDYSIFLGFLHSMTYFDLRGRLFNEVFESSELLQLKRSIRDCTAPRVGLSNTVTQRRLQATWNRVASAMERELTAMNYQELSSVLTRALSEWTGDQSVVLQVPGRAASASASAAI